MGSVNRIAGSVGVAFSFICAGATVALSTWILAAPDDSSSDVASFGGDVRALLLIPVVLVAAFAAALATDGGPKRTKLGAGALAVTLFCVLVLWLVL